MEKRAVLKNYGLLGAMLAAMLTGGVTGWLWPAAAGTVRPLGQIFINLMFCVVVPLVFSSIAGAIAGMRSVRRAGRIMGVTVLTFVVTGILAAVLMFLLMKAFPPVLTPWQSLPTEAVGDYAAPGQLLVNFFTAEDFVGLLSRRAMLPLIVFSVLLGFAANLTGGPDGPVARGLTAVTQVMMEAEGHAVFRAAQEQGFSQGRDELALLRLFMAAGSWGGFLEIFAVHVIFALIDLASVFQELRGNVPPNCIFHFTRSPS